MKRILKYIVIISLLLLTTLLTISFILNQNIISPSSEFNTTINTLKTLNNNTNLEEYNITINNVSQLDYILLQNIYKNLHYEIIEENINNNQATLKIKITNSNIYLTNNTLYQNTLDKYYEDETWPTDEEYINELINNLNTNVETKEITLNYEKTNNKWYLTNEDINNKLIIGYEQYLNN